MYWMETSPKGHTTSLYIFRTSPVESCVRDAHERRLDVRWGKLFLQYAPKIKSLSKHPIHEVERSYVGAHESSLDARRAKISLHYASKIKSLPKPSHTWHHDMVFANKCMKLFDSRPNAIRTFGLRIKRSLIAVNIDFKTFWKDRHILFYHLGVSNHRRLCWIWCITEIQVSWLHS